jgi:hypothetical protein
LAEGGPLIHPLYPKDEGHDGLQEKRSAVAAMLRDAVADGRKPTRVDCSSIVDGLQFQLDWTHGVLVTETSYSAYRHAEEFHRLAFLHAKKFVIARPFFLTFVVFPWFNNNVTDFHAANKIFYRSFARRVFCQYRHDPTQLSAWYSKFTGNETIHAVAEQLGAILFLEDNSIMGMDSEDVNVAGFYYENPNGLRSPTQGMMKTHLHSLVREYDYFEHDNY